VCENKAVRLTITSGGLAVIILKDDITKITSVWAEDFFDNKGEHWIMLEGFDKLCA
jgi:hypothetical protein